MPEVILSAQELVKHYPIKRGVLRRTVGQVKAVDGVSFDLHQGETLGIVGESGCGKSTLGRLLMRLEEPTAGKVIFEGADWSSASGREMRRMRRDIQIVFQDPYTSLNPRMTVGDIIGEPFEIHPDVVPKGGRRKRVQELLDLVGLNPEHINRYPHQFSGGQRQRIGIARGLALQPQDPRLRRAGVGARRVGAGAGRSTCWRSCRTSSAWPTSSSRTTCRWCGTSPTGSAVMYLGKIVEMGDEDEIYDPPDAPVHPGAALGRAGARPDAARQARPDRAGGRRALAGQPAVGLPVPHPLLEGAGDLRAGGAAARAAARRRG